MTCVKSPSSWIEKHLVFGVPNNFASSLNLNTEKITKFEKIINSITTYQSFIKTKILEPEKALDILIGKLSEYVDNLHCKINVSNVDVNYYLKNIKYLFDKKFDSVLAELELTHIISMFDYSNTSTDGKSMFKKILNEYYKLFNEKILFGKYGNENVCLHEILDDKWTKIDYKYLIFFTNILSKMQYYSLDVKKYEDLLSEKMNQEPNVIKLLDLKYIILKYKVVFVAIVVVYNNNNNHDSS